MTAVSAQGQFKTIVVAPVLALLFSSAFFWPLPLGPLATEMAIHIGLMSLLGPLVAALCVYALRRTRSRGAGWLWIATISQIALLWALHIPNVHHAVMMSALLRAIALASLFLLAVGFWFRLLDRRASPPWQEVLALLITTKLACLLAVLLVFAPREIYPGMQPVAVSGSADGGPSDAHRVSPQLSRSWDLACDAADPIGRFRSCARPASQRADVVGMNAGFRRMRLVRAAIIVLAVSCVGAFLFAWSGIYSVAASRGHWTIVEYFLAFVMRNSVERRAALIESPPLDDEALILLGAGAYHSGCAWCHGAPGIPTNPVTRAMLPAPPELSERLRAWNDEELFWIVQHGIKYTGMPAWPSQRRQDEVWAVVAFLRRIEDLDAQGYRELALGPVQTEETGREIAIEADAVEAAVACARCHGAERTGPRSALVPTLHGQPAEFLIAALEAYRNGERESGVMQPLANDLTPEDLERVARYYARLALPALAFVRQRRLRSVERTPARSKWACRKRNCRPA